MSNARKTLGKWLFSDTRILGFDLIALLFLFGTGVIWSFDLLHAPVWTPDGMPYRAGIDLVRMDRSWHSKRA